MDFRNGTNNENKTDWFVPSCGELAYMFLKMEELNILINKVNGTPLSDSEEFGYWSSSESSAASAWGVYFSVGGISNFMKNINFHLRLIRAI